MHKVLSCKPFVFCGSGLKLVLPITLTLYRSIHSMYCRVKEQLEDVDDKLQLRRKARNTAADVRRQLPQVSLAWYNPFMYVLCLGSILPLCAAPMSSCTQCDQR